MNIALFQNVRLPLWYMDLYHRGRDCSIGIARARTPNSEFATELCEQA